MKILAGILLFMLAAGFVVLLLAFVIAWLIGFPLLVIWLVNLLGVGIAYTFVNWLIVWLIILIFNMLGG